jgi:hypothetical protein
MTPAQGDLFHFHAAAQLPRSHRRDPDHASHAPATSSAMSGKTVSQSARLSNTASEATVAGSRGPSPESACAFPVRSGEKSGAAGGKQAGEIKRGCGEAHKGSSPGMADDGMTDDGKKDDSTIGDRGRSPLAANPAVRLLMWLITSSTSAGVQAWSSFTS